MKSLLGHVLSLSFLTEGINLHLDHPFTISHVVSFHLSRLTEGNKNKTIGNPTNHLALMSCQKQTGAALLHPVEWPSARILKPNLLAK